MRHILKAALQNFSINSVLARDMNKRLFGRNIASTRQITCTKNNLFHTSIPFSKKEKINVKRIIYNAKLVVMLAPGDH